MDIPTNTVIARLRTMMQDPCKALRFLVRLKSLEGPFEPVLDDYARDLFPRWGWVLGDYLQRVEAVLQEVSRQGWDELGGERPPVEVTVKAYGISFRIYGTEVDWIPCAHVHYRSVWGFWATDKQETKTLLLQVNEAVGGQLLFDAKVDPSPAGRYLYDLMTLTR